ncbi:MAG: DUF488 domain-containing protein, partial [Nitrospirota bacterium]
MTIYTLGTSRRSEEDFIEILLAYDIEAVIDVRRFPKSKLPLFRRENLEPLLRREGIEYHYLAHIIHKFFIHEDFKDFWSRSEPMEDEYAAVLYRVTL